VLVCMQVCMYTQNVCNPKIPKNKAPKIQVSQKQKTPTLEAGNPKLQTLDLCSILGRQGACDFRIVFVCKCVFVCACAWVRAGVFVCVCVCCVCVFLVCCVFACAGVSVCASCRVASKHAMSYRVMFVCCVLCWVLFCCVVLLHVVCCVVMYCVVECRVMSCFLVSGCVVPCVCECLCVCLLVCVCVRVCVCA
jgi:hypothetical protein